MRKVKLSWSNSWPVTVLNDLLKSEEHFRNPIPELKGKGVYMFLDKNTGKARYIGQASKNSPIALQIRVRWEIVKDGKDCAMSKFNEKCAPENYNVDKRNLLLKVAHLENPQKDGINVEIDRKFLNAVEGALIFESARAGNHLMNETWITSYGLGPIEILNDGDSRPLSPIINLREHESMKLQ